MLLFKFNLFILASLLFSSAYAMTSFTAKECLHSNFETKISHDAQPFGFAKRILDLKKEGCLIKINHEKLRFVKSAWEIDVCRGPIHIKSGAGAVSVSRRQGRCSQVDDSSFCQDYRTITDLLESDGLIFAKGEKENLETPHGMVYCTYSLVEKYLREGQILSRHDESSLPTLNEEETIEIEQEENTFEEAIVPQKIEDEANDEEAFPESDEPGEF